MIRELITSRRLPLTRSIDPHHRTIERSPSGDGVDVAGGEAGRDDWVGTLA